jgi:uncharacterized membrane protein YhaH (DUF805 family)
VVAGLPPGFGTQAPRARRVREDEDTLNPLQLLLLCFRPSGRFSRAQFAIAYLGSVVAFWTMVLGAGFAGGLAGLGEDAAMLVVGLVALVFFPAVLASFVGGGIRRWHDLGKSGWYVVLGFVPCAGVLALLYLLLAPGRPDAGEAPRSTPVLAIVAAVLVVGVFGVGLVAAIAIPSLLRARVAANESATIGDIRTVISAQAAYQSANGGYYDANLECLASPATGCVPGYPAEGPTFLDPALASRQAKSGYARRFDPGAMIAVDASLSSQTSVESWAYVAVPVAPGQTGVRSFCGDSSGRICFRPDGGGIPTEGGQCPVDSGGCTPLF